MSLNMNLNPMAFSVKSRFLVIVASFFLRADSLFAVKLEMNVVEQVDMSDKVKLFEKNLEKDGENLAGNACLAYTRHKLVPANSVKKSSLTHNYTDGEYYNYTVAYGGNLCYLGPAGKRNESPDGQRVHGLFRHTQKKLRAELGWEDGEIYASEGKDKSPIYGYHLSFTLTKKYEQGEWASVQKEDNKYVPDAALAEKFVMTSLKQENDGKIDIVRPHLTLRFRLAQPNRSRFMPLNMPNTLGKAASGFRAWYLVYCEHGEHGEWVFNTSAAQCNGVGIRKRGPSLDSLGQVSKRFYRRKFPTAADYYLNQMNQGFVPAPIADALFALRSQIQFKIDIPASRNWFKTLMEGRFATNGGEGITYKNVDGEEASVEIQKDATSFQSYDDIKSKNLEL